MKELFVACFLIWIWPLQLAMDLSERLIVWNVGQGLFATLVEHTRCLHFDMGGEKPPPRSLLQAACLGRKNEVSFSHWDRDHVGMANRTLRILPNLCVRQWPGGTAKNPHSYARLHQIPECAASGTDGPIELTTASNNKTSNGQSRVWTYRNILFPGDSTMHEERIWADKIKSPLKTWILGHHGSRTSSGKELTEHFQRGAMAIASARWAKYHHPHPEVAERLLHSGIALERTEDWGHLNIELTPKDSKGNESIRDRPGIPNSGREPLARSRHNRHRHSNL